jgi:DNA/RNA-binding domain of Phe-tRNA-synthetase-like protein
MSSVAPFIAPEVLQLAPGFRALSIVAHAAPIQNPQAASQALEQACQAVLAGAPAWADSHLGAWAEVFQAFGAKPKRTPCSADALRKRVLRDGTLPNIDPVVDLYNAISLQYAVPVGGENLAAYAGSPQLTVADGSELFDCYKDGVLANDPPAPGEVVWRDEQGVTCRRWNWRQGVRTRLDANAQQMWFILESLPAMPLAALHEAGQGLMDGLRQMMPGVMIEDPVLL